MSDAPRKPILCLDFDGVIHRYSEGWKDGGIYDTPTDGFAEWAREAVQWWTLVVYSSRSATPEGQAAMRDWMRMHSIDDSLFSFADTKPPAFLTIDDRCIQFAGQWDWLNPQQLLQFKTWNER